MAKQVSKSHIFDMIDVYGKEKGLELVYTFGKLLRNMDNPLRSLVRAGNLKIPKETAIFNMSSATDCASLAKGLCKACVFDPSTQEMKTVCYALKSERSYRPDVLPFRRRQNEYWLDISAEDFAIQFLILNSCKRNKFNKIRLNEAGDFHFQSCIDKADNIARILKKFGISMYCYTSRDDLDYTKVKSLVINASGFKRKGLKNEFHFVEKGKKAPKGYAKCPADCRICDRCSKLGKRTYINQH